MIASLESDVITIKFTFTGMIQSKRLSLGAPFFISNSD